MKFKKMLSAILAGIMLVGGTVSVSAAGTVYTAEDFCKPVYSIPGYYGYYYNYLNGWGCDGLKPSFVWNPVLGKYEACTCKTCAGITAPTLPGSYYWVNGVYYKADEYHKNFVEKETVTVTPVQPT